VGDGLYLCKVTTTSEAHAFRFVLAEHHGRAGAIHRQPGSSLARSEASTAGTSTLITTCPGFIPDTLSWVEKTNDSVTIRLRDSGSVTPSPTARIVLPFDTNWLFNKGDATGADKASFADAGWRKVDVPFDWSIEGPYDQNANTGGYGGYLPSGIGWFRKHFTLPSNFSGRRVFVEFDGVMSNSTVYLNGTSLGNRPYGYMSFRYEITSLLNSGATENVLSVKADNSLQEASRWYAGAGINRHVRLIATNPIHIDKWATVVTTPTTSAVHVATTIVNQGTTAQSVSILATLVDPDGVKLAPVASTAQSIPAGGSADFKVDVPVANPQLWSLESPSMYRVVTAVQSSGATIDDESIPFGIRTMKFDPETGFLLNGKSVKIKGVCLHHEVGGLGAAVPLRAWQRRLAVLKSIGVNAIRTSHNPFDPQVLDLFDRMGFLVMDEFFDVWTGHKYSMAGDYATYFKTWYQTDATDIVKRDRNHPSIFLYSIGNEIRESLATRLPYTKTLVNICHANDSTRPVTQALFQPSNAGDYPGGTLDVLDVFGVNYRNAELLTAITATPHHAGISTEMGMTPSLWNSFYMKNPQIAGEFIWTGAVYLGEADGAWPVVVGTDSKNTIFGLVDRVSDINDMGYQYQAVWSTNPVVKPTTVTSGATKVVLTVDHPAITTDFEDVAYVRASITDASGNRVSTASNAVTFQVTGTAGKIVAVDNGGNEGETYRGNVRTAYQGACYAIVRMTAPGSITITASASGLAGSSTTVTGTSGSFVPCSGKCD